MDSIRPKLLASKYSWPNYSLHSFIKMGPYTPTKKNPFIWPSILKVLYLIKTKLTGLKVPKRKPKMPAIYTRNCLMKWQHGGPLPRPPPYALRPVTQPPQPRPLSRPSANRPNFHILNRPRHHHRHRLFRETWKTRYLGIFIKQMGAFGKLSGGLRPENRGGEGRD